MQQTTFNQARHTAASRLDSRLRRSPVLATLYVLQMNRQEAQSLVEIELSKLKSQDVPHDCVVLESKTIERAWGWVFFYQSKEYLNSGKFEHMLAGNAPLLVNRNTGNITHTGTAHNIEHYIKEYESTL